MMGIRNIYILTETATHRLAHQAQIALQEKLMDEHRKGMHTYGNMRRECPLCQSGR